MSLLSVIAGPAVPSHIYKWHYENLAASISRIVKARDDIYHTKTLCRRGQGRGQGRQEPVLLL